MIGVDTNVLIYACDQADPRRQTIALDLITNSSDGVLLWQFLGPDAHTLWIVVGFRMVPTQRAGGESVARALSLRSEVTWLRRATRLRIAVSI